MKTIIQIEIEWNEGFVPTYEQIEEAKMIAFERITLEGMYGCDFEHGTIQRKEWKEEDMLYIAVGKTLVDAVDDDESSETISQILEDEMCEIIEHNKNTDTLESLLEKMDGWDHFTYVSKEKYEDIINHPITDKAEITYPKFDETKMS